MAHYIKALQTYGLKGTVKRLYQFKDIKFGTYMGTDELGNKYFQNNDYPAGQNRWVEPKIFDSGSLTDASWVSPTWHGWLHYTHDKIPTAVGIERGTGSPLAENVDTPIDSHYNREHTKPWRPNPTLHRERGYGVDHHFGKAGENNFYVQPGHVQNPEQKNLGQRFESWDSAPTPKPTTVPIKREKWEEFYEQRKRMNASK